VIVIDTTVLVYATGAAHPLRDPSRRLIAAIAEGEIEATTTVEVIQELVHVRARRSGRIDAAGLGRDCAELLSPLLHVSHEDLRRGLALFETAPPLGAFDAVLAAAAASAGATALVSTDQAFAAVPALRHAIPDEPGVAALLSS